MRRTLIIALVVFALSAGVCVGCAGAVNRAVSEANGLRLQAMELALQNHPDAARQLIARMAAQWEARSRVLQLMLSHDALSDVKSAIADVAICLEVGDRAEFLRAAAALGAALERIHVAEAVRFANMF